MSVQEGNEREEMPEDQMCVWIRGLFLDAIRFSMDESISTEDASVTLPQMTQACLSHIRYCERCHKAWMNDAEKIREKYKVPATPESDG